MATDVRHGPETPKALFCGALIATHRAWEPERVAWPALDDDALARLRALPFWAEALGTERETAAKIRAYAATVSDAVLREAIALQGYEEDRHARLLEVMLDRYAIAVEPRMRAALPANVERAFVDAGMASASARSSRSACSIWRAARASSRRHCSR
jgi:hypothetical protein